MNRLLLSLGAALVISVGASFAWSPLMALMFLMPLLAGLQRSRLSAYMVAVAYYAGASWALVPASRNFLGPSPSPLSAVALWFLSAVLLASPFALVWSDRPERLAWQLPIGSVINAVPPLGIIGWASPLTSAGLLFPATGWFGLIATAALPGLLLVRPRVVFGAATTLVLVSNLLSGGIPSPPTDWQAVSTEFGGVAHDPLSPVAQFVAAERVQEIAQSSGARIIMFPETVVPIWTEATGLFWQPTFAALRASGKTILLGVGMPMIGPEPGGSFTGAPKYRNAVLIAGAESGLFFQRIPVPIGMWKPFSDAGVPLNVSGKGTVQIGGFRAAVLICYEQLLPWPVLQSMTERPSVVMAVANEYWVQRTPIPRCQAASVRTWARLFHVPVLSATNR